MASIALARMKVIENPFYKLNLVIFFCFFFLFIKERIQRSCIKRWSKIITLNDFFFIK